VQAFGSLEMLTLLGGVLIVALLYSSVGHGGASGYIALMVLCGVAPLEIRPVALFLNILVALIATIAFFRSGHFSWRLFWPFALASIPASYLGGGLHLPQEVYRTVIGGVMLFCAFRLFWRSAKAAEQPIRTPALPFALSIGAILGLLSGLTGVGGGIFLSPLLLLMDWARPKEAAGIAAPFILVNSIAGLLGYLHALGNLPTFAPPLALAALTGAFIGTHLGSRHFAPATVNRLLSLVLVIAGLKLLMI